MAATHVTGAADALDLICLRHYGQQAGMVEQVLEANPHIRNIAHDLPIGVKINLPDLNVQVKASQPLRLWD